MHKKCLYDSLTNDKCLDVDIEFFHKCSINILIDSEIVFKL